MCCCLRTSVWFLYYSLIYSLTIWFDFFVFYCLAESLYNTDLISTRLSLYMHCICTEQIRKHQSKLHVNKYFMETKNNQASEV